MFERNASRLSNYDQGGGGQGSATLGPNLEL